MATDASDQEQQQRELEEIRRQFAEVGERISAFEPAAADDDRERPLALAPTTAPADEQPASPAHRQRRELKEIRHRFIEVGQRWPPQSPGTPVSARWLPSATPVPSTSTCQLPHPRRSWTGSTGLRAAGRWWPICRPATQHLRDAANCSTSSTPACTPGQAAAIVQGQAQAIHGLGGIGKTQLALEYAHKHASNYELVWWVTAEEPATIPGQLVALARRLDIAEATEQAETVQLLWDELRQRHRWLVIFDNAEAPADLRPWWPPASGRVLVTSRHPTWGGLATAVPLDVLTRDESRLFLQRRLCG